MQLQCHRACVSLVIEAVLLPIGLGQPLGIGGAEVALQLLGIKVGMRSCLVPPCFNDARGIAQLLMSGRAWPGSAAPSVVGDGLHLSPWVVSGEENHHRRGRRRKSQASHRLSQASDAADSCVVSGPPAARQSAHPRLPYVLACQWCSALRRCCAYCRNMCNFACAPAPRAHPYRRHDKGQVCCAVARQQQVIECA